MNSSQLEGRRWSALQHPLWWGALALLLVNDHLLKGAGLLPSFLTGKLKVAGDMGLALKLGSFIG